MHLLNRPEHDNAISGTKKGVVDNKEGGLRVGNAYYI